MRLSKKPQFPASRVALGTAAERSARYLKLFYSVQKFRELSPRSEAFVMNVHAIQRGVSRRPIASEKRGGRKNNGAETEPSFTQKNLPFFFLGGCTTAWSIAFKATGAITR